MQVFRALLLLVVAAGCGQNPAPVGGAESVAVPCFVDYMASRVGVSLEPPLRWQGAEWAEDAGSVRAAVVLCGGVMLTEDGELLPVRAEYVRLGADVLSEYSEGPPVAMWVGQFGYIDLSKAARQWMRHALMVQQEVQPSERVASELADVEVRRMTRDLREQWRPWSRAARSAIQLEAWARHVGVGGEVLARCQRLSRKLEQAAEFEEASQRMRRRADLIVRSEVNSVGGSMEGGRAPVGQYTVEYSWLSRRELAVLAEYWDSDVWTRSVFRAGMGWSVRTVGENVQAAAARMTGIVGVTSEEFLEWVRQ